VTARGPFARPLARVAAFFHRHPVLFLLALTPGIPEYLSGSTPVAAVVYAPPTFLLFLGINLALYGPGVLLVREAWVRLGGGWGALLCFGAAYGLLEEGTALSTLFDPGARVVGSLGHYGRFAGINGVWLGGILGVHLVFSVGLPLLLLGLALPETRGRALLSRRGVAIAAVVYAGDILLLAAIVGFWRVELAWLVGAAVVAALLWVVAFRLPRGFLDPPRERPSHRPAAFLLAGLCFYPILLLVPALGAAARAPAALTLLVELLLAGLLFVAVRRAVGRSANEPQLVLLALGATLPLVFTGLLSQLALPVVVLVDVVYVLFFAALWRKYRPVDVPAPPAGAVVP
jgi:hypothetical protein